MSWKLDVQMLAGSQLTVTAVQIFGAKPPSGRQLRPVQIFGAKPSSERQQLMARLAKKSADECSNLQREAFSQNFPLVSNDNMGTKDIMMI